MSDAATAAAYNPAAVVDCLFANLLARPAALASLVAHWEAQHARPQPVLAGHGISAAAASTPPADPTTALVRAAAATYVGVPIDFELIGQTAVMPLETDSRARAFGVFRIVLATAHGVCALTLDDVFLTEQRHWRRGADLRPVVWALGIMALDVRRFWTSIDSGGMAGHFVARNFLHTTALCERFWSPAALLVVQCALRLEAVGPAADAATAEARRLASALQDVPGLPWPRGAPAHEIELVRDLAAALAFWDLPHRATEGRERLAAVAATVEQRARDTYAGCRAAAAETPQALPCRGASVPVHELYEHLLCASNPDA